MIVERDSKEPALGVIESKIAEAKDQRSSDGHEKQFLGLGLLWLTQTVADALLQSRRHRHIAHRVPELPAQIAAVLCLPGARRAAPEMLDHLEIAFGQQFIVDVTVELRAKLLARLLAKSDLSHDLVSFWNSDGSSHAHIGKRPWSLFQNKEMGVRIVPHPRGKKPFWT
jgi:hypothetical protein